MWQPFTQDVVQFHVRHVDLEAQPGVEINAFLMTSTTSELLQAFWETSTPSPTYIPYNITASALPQQTFNRCQQQHCLRSTITFSSQTALPLERTDLCQTSGSARSMSACTPPSNVTSSIWIDILFQLMYVLQWSVFFTNHSKSTFEFLSAYCEIIIIIVKKIRSDEPIKCIQYVLCFSSQCSLFCLFAPDPILADQCEHIIIIVPVSYNSSASTSRLLH